MKIQINKINTIFLAAIIAATLIICLPAPAVANPDTPTPAEWVNLILQTPGGAWRPEQGVTKYPWLIVGHDAGRAGYTASPAPKTNHTLWVSNVRCHELTNLAVDEGRVFAATSPDATLFCLDAYTGDVIWKAPTPRSFTEGHITIADGTIYSDNLAVDGHFYGYATTSGGVSWELPVANFTGYAGVTSTQGAPSLGLPQMSMAVVVGDQIYAQVYNPSDGVGYYMWCFQRGEKGLMVQKWSTNIDNLSATTDKTHTRLPFGFAVADGKIYVNTLNDLVCLNAADGTWIWTTSDLFSSDWLWQTPIVIDGRVYQVSGVKNSIWCLDANTGKLQWEYETEGDYTGGINGGNGKVYILGGSTDQKVYALDATNGNLLWTFTTPGGSPGVQSTTIADGNIYFTSFLNEGTQFGAGIQGVVYCVNADTGKLVWSWTRTITGQSVSIADGYAYTVGADRDINCIGPGPTTTAVSLTSSSLNLGSATAIIGSVTDMSPFSQQHPELQSPLMSGVPVVLSYVKDGTWTDFATVTTASDGTFAYTFLPPSVGLYKVVARFEGDTSYEWSSGQAAVQVGPASAATKEVPDYTPIFGGIIAAVAVTIGLVLYGIVTVRKLRK